MLFQLYTQTFPYLQVCYQNNLTPGVNLNSSWNDVTSQVLIIIEHAVLVHGLRDSGPEAITDDYFLITVKQQTCVMKPKVAFPVSSHIHVIL
jgi:hypothetical protein